MHSRIAIYFTFCLALALTLLPMPEWTLWLRPAWIVMVLIYWAMTLPLSVGVGTAWTLGLIVDLFTGVLLGEHALAYTVVIYFVDRISIRLRMFPNLQQGFCIFTFVLLYQFIIYCIQGFIGELPSSHFYWLSSLTSILFWPWLFIFLRNIRKRLNLEEG